MFSGFRSRWTMPRSCAAAGDLRRVLDRLAPRQRALCQPVAQRLAVEQLHDESAVLEAVHLGDVRVVERRERPGFAFEARETIRIAGEGVGQNLDGDVAAEPRIARAIDFAHPAGAQGGLDVIRAEAGAGAEQHRLSEDRIIRPMQSCSKFFDADASAVVNILHRTVAFAPVFVETPTA